MEPTVSPQIRVSVDVGCYQHSVAIGLSTGQIVDEFEIQHSQEGFKQFFAHIEQLVDAHGYHVAVAMEGYNGWARPLDQLVLAKGYQLYNINNLKLARFKEIFPSSAKTDAIDARKGLELFTLSDHLSMAKNCLQRVKASPKVHDQLKRYTRRRRRLVKERVSLKAHLHSDLQSVCPELLEITHGIGQVWYLNFLSSAPSLPQLARKRKSSLEAIPGVGRKYREVIQRWQQQAVFADDVEWVGEMILSDVARMQELRAEINALDKKIAELLAESENAQNLLSIPGFGVTCVGEIVGEIGSISRFTTEGSLAMYLGMAPLNNESGNYRGSKTPKQINKRAKMAMMTAVDRHRHKVDQSGRFYQKKKQEGKRHNQAVRALGRHLCRVIFKLLTEQRDYELRSK